MTVVSVEGPTLSRRLLSVPTCAQLVADLYGMGAAGERGVDHVIKFLDEGIRRTMALSGRRSIEEIDRDLVEWRV